MDTHEKASFSFSKPFPMPAGVFGRKVGRECGFLESTPFLGWRPQPLPPPWLSAHMVSEQGNPSVLFFVHEHTDFGNRGCKWKVLATWKGCSWVFVALFGSFQTSFWLLYWERKTSTSAEMKEYAVSQASHLLHTPRNVTFSVLDSHCQVDHHYQPCIFPSPAFLCLVLGSDVKITRCI